MKDLPQEERPREKLLAHGANALSNAELLAILLHTGYKDRPVLHVAEEILALYKEQGLGGIANLSAQDFSAVKGVGGAKAAVLIAAIELGRRLAQRAAKRRWLIRSAEDVAAYMMPRLRDEMREHFVAVLLNVKNRVLAAPVISVGSLNASIVHPRELFREAVRASAAGVILVHNHPSGDPSPSREDLAVTRSMIAAGELMQIPVLDHVILGDDTYRSLKEEGLME